MRKPCKILILILIVLAVVLLYLDYRYGTWYLIVLIQRITHVMGFH